MAVIEEDDPATPDASVALAYRCDRGHDWTTAYGLSFAIGHSAASRREYADHPDWVYPRPE